MRPAPLFLLLAGSCGIFGLTPEEANRLSQYRERARIYYDGNRLPQALDQVRQGLEIDAEDYQLSVIKGFCLLRQAKDPRFAPTEADRRRLLAAAEVAFESAMALRPLDEHGYQALLGDALLREELARQRQAEARQLEEELAAGQLAPEEQALRRVRLQELELQSREHLLRAERSLGVLLERGDQVLLAHKHAMSIELLQRDWASAVRHGEAYLARSKEIRGRRQEQFEGTRSVDREQALLSEIKNLVDDEILVRSQLANVHYDQGNYDLAVRELNQILTLDPARPADYFNRARALFQLGRYEEAYRDAQKFLATQSLPAGHAFVRRAHDLLEELERKRQ